MCNARKRDTGNLSALTMSRLFLSLKSSRNKGWVRRVPAAAVTPAAQVVVMIIESKAFVAGFVNL